MGFLDEVRHLGSLETFDPKAFEPDDQWSPDLCHFIVALAVASNDLHDVFLAQFLLKEVQDTHKDDSDVAYKALSGGTVIALRRFQVGVIHELLQLVKKNDSVVASEAFQKLYTQLDRSSKRSWDRVYGAAMSKPQSGTLGKALLMCRNKVGFHYDAGQIGKGYQQRFLCKHSKTHGPPVISRGNSMRARRFYFADAAIEQYMVDLAQDPEIEKTFLGRGQLIQDINRALFGIVTRFINARKIGYREYRHQGRLA